MTVNAALTAEAVKGTSLTFQRIDHIHGGDSFALGMSVYVTASRITHFPGTPLAPHESPRR